MRGRYRFKGTQLFPVLLAALCLVPRSLTAEFIQVSPLVYQSSERTDPDSSGFILMAVVPGPAHKLEVMNGLFIAWGRKYIPPQSLSFEKVNRPADDEPFDSCFLRFDATAGRYDRLYLSSGNSYELPGSVSLELGDIGRLSTTSVSSSPQYLTVTFNGKKDASIIGFLGLQYSPVLRESGEKAMKVLEAFVPSNAVPYRIAGGAISIRGELQTSISFPINSEDSACLLQGARYVPVQSEKASSMLAKLKSGQSVLLPDLEELMVEAANPADYIPLKSGAREFLALGVNGGLYRIHEERGLSYSSPLCLVERILLEP